MIPRPIGGIYLKHDANVIVHFKEFSKTSSEDPEITVSDRISLLDRETENCKIQNPNFMLTRKIFC